MTGLTPGENETPRDRTPNPEPDRCSSPLDINPTNPFRPWVQGLRGQGPSDASERPSPGPTGRHPSAQGAALGKSAPKQNGLKGRDTQAPRDHPPTKGSGTEGPGAKRCQHTRSAAFQAAAAHTPPHSLSTFYSPTAEHAEHPFRAPFAVPKLFNTHQPTPTKGSGTKGSGAKRCQRTGSQTRTA